MGILQGFSYRIRQGSFGDAPETRLGFFQDSYGSFWDLFGILGICNFDRDPFRFFLDPQRHSIWKCFRYHPERSIQDFKGSFRILPGFFKVLITVKQKRNATVSFWAENPNFPSSVGKAKEDNNRRNNFFHVVATESHRQQNFNLPLGNFKIQSKCFQFILHVLFFLLLA